MRKIFLLLPLLFGGIGILLTLLLGGILIVRRLIPKELRQKAKSGVMGWMMEHAPEN
ncbi:MAG: hypothetical protein ACE5JL_07690 [Dehalococcoidia bacterium]